MKILNNESQKKLRRLLSDMTGSIIDIEELSDECSTYGFNDLCEKLEGVVEVLCVVQSELLKKANS